MTKFYTVNLDMDLLLECEDSNDPTDTLQEMINRIHKMDGITDIMAWGAKSFKEVREA